MKLPIGQTRSDFQVTLPSDIPSSLIFPGSSSSITLVSYKIQATIVRPQDFDEGQKQAILFAVKKPFYVLRSPTKNLKEEEIS